MNAKMFHHNILFLTVVTLAVVWMMGPLVVNDNNNNGMASACIGGGDPRSNEMRRMKRGGEGAEETEVSDCASTTTTTMEEAERNYASISPIPHARQMHTFSKKGRNRKNNSQHYPPSHHNKNKSHVVEKEEEDGMRINLYSNHSISSAPENISSSSFAPPSSSPPATSHEAITPATIAICPGADLKTLKDHPTMEGVAPPLLSSSSPPPPSSSGHYFSSSPSSVLNVVEVEDLSNDYPSSRDKGPDGKYCGSFSLGVVKGEVFAKQSNSSFDFHMEGFHQNITCLGERYEYDTRTHHADVPGSRDPEDCLGSLLTGANITLDVLYFPKTDQVKLDFGFTYVKCKKCE